VSSTDSVARNATHARILETAWRLVEASGLDVSMEAIARASGLSRQALYLYVDHRAGLFTQMARHRDEQADIAARFAGALQAPTALQALEAVIATWFDYLLEILPVARALMSAATTDAHAATAWWDRMDAALVPIGLVIDRLSSEQLLDPGWERQVAVELLWALTHVRLYDDLVHHHGWSHQQVIDRQTAAVERTLLRVGGVPT
jgi:AcrR family transcriptional regulator